MELEEKLGDGLEVTSFKKIISRRFSEFLEGEELESVTLWLEQIVMRKGCSEFGFAKMFPYFNRSEHAISNHLEEYKELGIEISFYYGTKDWMNTCFNGLNVSTQLEEAGQKVIMVPEAGHHIYF